MTGEQQPIQSGAVPSPQQQAAAPGWYVNGVTGATTWWDGTKWTVQQAPSMGAPAAPPAPQHTTGPMTAASLNVRRDVSYVRQQTGHSLTKHLLWGIFILWANVIYISVSPNHYWHA